MALRQFMGIQDLPPFAVTMPANGQPLRMFVHPEVCWLMMLLLLLMMTMEITTKERKGRVNEWMSDGLTNTSVASALRFRLRAHPHRRLRLLDHSLHLFLLVLARSFIIIFSFFSFTDGRGSSLCRLCRSEKFAVHR